jgi:hypothetical protein
MIHQRQETMWAIAYDHPLPDGTTVRKLVMDGDKPLLKHRRAGAEFYMDSVHYLPEGAEPVEVTVDTRVAENGGGDHE